MTRYALRAKVFDAIGRRADENLDDGVLPEAKVVALTRQEGQAASLSQREHEVLGLMADGLTNAEIARRLFITPNTSTSHTRHIIAKLTARSRAHAVALGFRKGIIR